MDQSSNINQKVVEGDFPIKYGAKTKKNHGQSIKKKKKTLGPFEITLKNTTGNPFFDFFKY